MMMKDGCYEVKRLLLVQSAALQSQRTEKTFQMTHNKLTQHQRRTNERVRQITRVAFFQALVSGACPAQRFRAQPLLNRA